MAEQISLEKTQLELELAQVKQQLERQQDRIKGIGNKFTSKTRKTKSSEREYVLHQNEIKIFKKTVLCLYSVRTVKRKAAVTSWNFLEPAKRIFFDTEYCQ